MPSFSLPHSSLDVEDLDSYLVARELQMTRPKAAKASGLSGYSYRTLVRLERRSQERDAQLRSLLAVSVPASREYQELSILVLSGVSVSNMNRYCLTRYFRGWFCGNISWLGRRTKAGMGLSHDLQNTLPLPDTLDSS